MPSRLASSNSGCTSGFGISLSKNGSASAGSSNTQRGKNVVSAHSGYTTSVAAEAVGLVQQGDQAIDDLPPSLRPRNRTQLGGGNPDNT